MKARQRAIELEQEYGRALANEKLAHERDQKMLQGAINNLQ